MRAVQRPWKVSKGFLGRLYNTEPLGNNSFQGLHKTWLVNFKILAGMEVAFREGLNFKKGWSLVLRQRGFCSFSDSLCVQFSHSRGEGKRDTRQLPSSSTLQSVPPALAAFLPAQTLKGHMTLVVFLTCEGVLVLYRSCFLLLWVVLGRTTLPTFPEKTGNLWNVRKKFSTMRAIKH